MGFHVFQIQDKNIWYKTAHICTDDEFEKTMSILGENLPLAMQVFHFEHMDMVFKNPIFEQKPVHDVPVRELFTTAPKQLMKLKDKIRGETLPIYRKWGDYVLARTDWGCGRFYRVTGETSSIVTDLHLKPISLKDAAAYVTKFHRHSIGPKFHKYSICLTVEDESLPVGVAVVSTPKARHLMDGRTLDINRCCVDPRYADACSKLYARAIGVGKNMGYTRFITYTLPAEGGSSLKAVGFRADGMVKASERGWDSPSRPRKIPDRYPTGEKIRWVLEF